MIKQKLQNPILNTITRNKRAYYEYVIKQELEAGISLHGWETKAVRAGKVNISDSYVMIRNHEAYLFGADIQPLTLASSHLVYDPIRIRKLLLNKCELNALSIMLKREGHTAVALSLCWKKSWVKVNIGIAKGKKKFDKRIDIKEQEWNLDKARIMKHVNR